MTDTLQARLAAALSTIVNPRTGEDVYASQQVRDIAVAPEGKVQVTLLLAPTDDATLARTVRVALEAVEGVSQVRVNVRDAAEPAAPAAAAGAASASAPAPKTRSLPVMGEPAPPARVAWLLRPSVYRTIC